MDLKLTNKVALVTGGSSGLGFAIARELACEGASVVIVARRKPELEHAAAEILKVARTRVLPLVGDVSKEGEAERLARTTEEALGPIDILLVNTVLPGHFDTARALELAQMRAEREKRPIDELMAARASGIPLGRSGDP